MSRVVLITGAAGGLGQELVTAFLGQECLVAAAYHTHQVHQSTDHLCPVCLDVTNPANVSTAVQDILKRWQRIDVLINNAGLAADRLLPSLADADWQRVLDVNLKGAFLCSQAALRPMLKQRSGHIVNIASFSGRVGAIGQTNYSAAKAGLFGLTQSLAREVGSRNICVNAVLPGVLSTPMTAALEPDLIAEFARANALGHINTTAEVARFIVFLTTLQNVSGQVFQLDSRLAAWT